MFDLQAKINLHQTSENKLTLLKNIDGLDVKAILFCNLRHWDKNYLTCEVKKQLSKVTTIQAAFSKYLNNNHKDKVVMSFKNRAYSEVLGGAGILNFRFQNQLNANDFTAEMTAGVNAKWAEKVKYELKGVFTTKHLLSPTLLFNLNLGKFGWGSVNLNADVNFATRRNHFRVQTQFQLSEKVWWNVKLKDLERLENCWGFQLQPGVQVFQSVSLDLDRKIENRGFVDFGVGIKMDV